MSFIFSIKATHTHEFMGIAQLAIESVLSDDDCAAFDADATACADPDEDGVLALGVVHQLDHLVHQNTDRGRSHAVTNTKHRANFVHRVAVRVGANVLQLGTRWQLVTDLVHYEMCKVLHALWCSAHANELVNVMKVKGTETVN